MAAPTVHTRAELRVFYGLVLALALYGQSTGASSWLIPPDAGPLHAAALGLLVIAFVLVLELGAVVLLRRAEAQRRAGQKAAVAILAAIALTLAAAALSWIGHWSPDLSDQIQAWAFAGSTLLGVIVWAIMADLAIDATVARHRSVAGAVRRYIKDLAMDDSEKAVLLATMDVPMITGLITGGPDALEAADSRDRNVRIAKILAKAIDPDTWHDSAPKPAVPESKPVPAPKPQRSESSPKTGRISRVDWREVADACERLRTELGRTPSARELADATPYGKSTTAKFLADPSLGQETA